jgi:hypothetical protein
VTLATLKRMGRRVLWKTSKRLYRQAVKRSGQTFSIGIFQGETPFGLSAARGVPNPVLTHEDVDDVPASFVADPFMICRNGRWHMFFEVLNSADRRGQIALATSDDGLNWNYARVVLREPFHLAYPYVFAWRNDVYMVPDSPGNGIRLYRASGFPHRWQLVALLHDGNIFSDSSLFEYEGRWWMFSGWVERKGDPISLRLFGADSPLGPWTEHPGSPVVVRNDRIGRPAGRVQVIDGHVYRFAQDCFTRYGQSVRVLQIDQLTATDYREREVSIEPILCAGDEWWNADGMHHIDAHPSPGPGWIACVDGWHLADGRG